MRVAVEPKIADLYEIAMVGRLSECKVAACLQ